MEKGIFVCIFMRHNSREALIYTPYRSHLDDSVVKHLEITMMEMVAMATVTMDPRNLGECDTNSPHSGCDGKSVVKPRRKKEIK